MATTAFHPGGYPGRPYGDFTGKEATAQGGPHNPGRITTLWAYGGPGHLYGSFAGKEASVSPVGEETGKTGTGGIDPGGGIRRRIVKPTGLLERPERKEARKEVEDRVDETREIHAEIAGQLARELAEDGETPIAQMSLAEVDREIGVLLRKVQRTQDEEILLLLLMAVA